MYWRATVGLPLTEVVVVTGYDALAEVYEWLISDAKLTPAEFAATFETSSVCFRQTLTSSIAHAVPGNWL